MLFLLLLLLSNIVFMKRNLNLNVRTCGYICCVFIWHLYDVFYDIIVYFCSLSVLCFIWHCNSHAVDAGVNVGVTSIYRSSNALLWFRLYLSGVVTLCRVYDNVVSQLPTVIVTSFWLYLLKVYNFILTYLLCVALADPALCINFNKGQAIFLTLYLLLLLLPFTSYNYIYLTVMHWIGRDQWLYTFIQM